jgi:hypothetical protein
MNPSEYFSVFNSMLQSELTIVGKTAISASNDVDTSIGLEELVSDLHRTCTATAFTYLYSIEVRAQEFAKSALLGVSNFSLPVSNRCCGILCQRQKRTLSQPQGLVCEEPFENGNG